jgi:hypothetical protein
MSIKSVDDLLITGTQTQREDAPEVTEKEEVEDAPEVIEKAEASDNEDDGGTSTESSLEGDSAETSSEVDDYGNEVPKARTYTEDEVQRMIRDRLSRGSVAQAEVKKAAENFEADPNNPESWEAQLEAFVEKTLDKRAGKLERETMEKQERARQVEFETKFNSGMEKYKDFREVVASKPITNAMMMAARNMKDPAAFIYAAAKTQAKELDRIAQLPDAYAQALEIGKLDERMRKTRSANSSAPPPVKHATGDMTTQKTTTKSNIDARIHAYGKRRYSR